MARVGESIVPLAIIDPKGKAAEVPSRKPKKKSKKTQTHVEGAPKKVKLLVPAISVGKTTTVYLALLFYRCRIACSS